MLDHTKWEVRLDNPVNQELLEVVAVEGQLQGINHGLLTRRAGIELEDIVNSALFAGYIANG